jgi:photosystem II stability/assembly factor-like uncharacterized protein
MKTAVMAVAVTALLAACSSPTASITKHATANATPTPAVSSLTPTLLPGPTQSPAPTPGPPLPVGPVPNGFAAQSVTFVSTQVGWVLGTAACADTTCLSLLHTIDSGRTWASIPAPPTTPSTGYLSGGVQSVRFADANDGWIFSPDLWATHDGGAHWARVGLPGADANAIVFDVEAAAGVVHAVALTATADQPVNQIYTSPVGTDRWQPSTTTVGVGAGPVPRDQFVLQGSAGWMVAIDRTIVGGARLVDGRWLSWQPPCLQANGPATLAAAGASDLYAVCDEGIWGPAPGGTAVRAYLSTDGGTTFRRTWSRLPPGCCGVIASPQPGVAVVAGGTGASGGLYATFNNGGSWTPVFPSGVDADLGFTSRGQGVAIDTTTGTMIMTFDGGHHWSAVNFRGR